MYLMDYIQMGLLVIVIPALILLLLYLIRKEIKDTDPVVVEYLKNETPEPMQESEKSAVKKDYVFSFLCGFLTTGLLFAVLTAVVKKSVFALLDTKEIPFENYVAIYYRIESALDTVALVFSILGPLLWISGNKKRLQTNATVVKLPAYVHSTSSLSTSYGNRTAYLVFWDGKAEKLRSKTVQIKKFESKYGKLHKGEFVLIAAEDRKTKIQFVNIFKKTA